MPRQQTRPPPNVAYILNLHVQTTDTPTLLLLSYLAVFGAVLLPSETEVGATVATPKWTSSVHIGPIPTWLTIHREPVFYSMTKKTRFLGLKIFCKTTINNQLHHYMYLIGVNIIRCHSVNTQSGVPWSHTWRRGSHHRRWPPGPSSTASRWTCSSGPPYGPAGRSRQSPLKTRTMTGSEEYCCIFNVFCVCSWPLT